jgi:hypothetical protein
MELQLDFTKPNAISTSSYGQDGFSIDVMDYSIFQSAIQDKNLTGEGIPLSSCQNYKASICKLMPPLMLNEDTVNLIADGAEQMGSAINLVATSNLIIAIVMGATVQ